jgi:hypothetical protein
MMGLGCWSDRASKFGILVGDDNCAIWDLCKHGFFAASWGSMVAACPSLRVELAKRKCPHLIRFSEEKESMNRTVLSILLAGLFAVPAFAQEKFTLKLKCEAKGDAIQSTEKNTEIAKATFSVMGNIQPKNDNKSVLSTFKQEIIDKEPGMKPTKLKRTYQKAEMTVAGKKKTLTFIGKEVLIDLSGPNQKFTVNGNELAGDDLVFMKEQFKEKSSKLDDSHIEDLMLPKNAVAVGGAWKPDVADLVKALSDKTDKMTVDVAKSTAAGKLQKAYKKDGKQFGAFEVVMNLALTQIGAGPTAIDLDATSRANIMMRFDGCIDGTSLACKKEMIMEIKMAGSLKAAKGVEVKLDAESKITGIQSIQDLTPAAPAAPDGSKP